MTVRSALLLFRRAASAALVLAAAPAALGAGWHFEPTPQDWEAWPQYCRVQYSFINRGENAYGDYYSDAAIAPWRQMIGDGTFMALHHYCKAMIILRQSRRERDPRMKRFLISVAIDDGDYSYVRTDPQSTVYPAVAAVMAEARFANGETDAAITILRRAIEAQPTRFEAYATLARIYREQHQLDKAVSIVREANEATHGESAEVQYSLGLLNLEAGNIDAAIKNAHDAYALGYPLPGLRDKLTKLGRWSEKPGQ